MPVLETKIWLFALLQRTKGLNTSRSCLMKISTKAPADPSHKVDIHSQTKLENTQRTRVSTGNNVSPQTCGKELPQLDFHSSL